MIFGLRKTFTQKTEAVNDSVTVQFLNISINIIIGLPAHLYATSCSKIAAKINEHLIQTLLNAESEINIINHKVAKAYDISIHCDVTLEMQTADSEKAPFYSCAEKIKVKIADVIFTLSIFITEEIENELIFKCL